LTFILLVVYSINGRRCSMDKSIRISEEAYEAIRKIAYKTRRTIKSIIDKKFNIKKKEKC